MRWPFILALLLIAAPSWALANAGGTEPPVVIEGPARIIDGDTIDIAGERIRLHGIDAPESRQMCTADGVTWSCGQRATNALSEFIGRSLVTCEAQDTDRYGRTIAACYVRGEDIEAWMVRGGWALAYRRYSLDYVDEEAVAQDARAGLWRGEFVPPWDWGRRSVRLRAATTLESAAGCTIKGNVSSSGEHIYHVPGGAYYDRTKITPAKGERWFCTEAEVIAAGWRKAKR